MMLVWLSSLLLLLSGCESSGARYEGPGMMDDKITMSLHRYTRQIQIQNRTSLDDHIYYTSTFYDSSSARARQLWFDIASLNETEIIPESGISDRFRVYEVHQLPFDFQFYGHTINIIAVTTGGFLYTSDFIHSRIHLTQYIAPLQADFDPSLNDSARILIHSSSERFTVQWDRVHAADHVEDGEFRFQVSLFRNGTIHFVYREIPLRVSQISNDEHPVEVGLADSFYIDRPIPPNLILRQVYEYSRIRLNQEDLQFSAFVIDPVPNCVPAQTCESCAMASLNTRFDCGWCSTLNRCSDGLDRFRQEWVVNGCPASSTTDCSNPTTATTTSTTTTTTTALPTTPTQPHLATTTNTPSTPAPLTTSTPPTTSSQPHLATSTSSTPAPPTPASPTPAILPLPQQRSQPQHQFVGGLSLSATVGISVGLTLLVVVLLVLVVAVCAGLLIYGYRHPNSSLGLFMIEHRPKARSLNKSKASYDVDSGKAALSED